MITYAFAQNMIYHNLGYAQDVGYQLGLRLICLTGTSIIIEFNFSEQYQNNVTYFISVEDVSFLHLGQDQIDSTIILLVQNDC